jgi:hypothetical protein
MLHLAVTTGLAIVLGIAVTPQGQSVITSSWNWLKGLFDKKGAPAPWRLWFGIRKKSHKGDEVELGFLWQGGGTPPAAPVGSQPRSFLNEFPPAVGCEQPPIPPMPVRPETFPVIPLPQVCAPAISLSETSRQSIRNVNIRKQRHVYKPVSRRRQSPSTRRRQASRSLVSSRSSRSGALRH